MAGNLQCISQVKKSWMREASASVPELLKPLAVTAAKLWLTKKDWGGRGYWDKSEFQVWFLKGYMSLNERGNISEKMSSWIWARDSDFDHASADEIEDLAAWARLPQTAHWYTGLGWILFEGPDSARAQYILGQAIELVCRNPRKCQWANYVASLLTCDRTMTLGSQWKQWHEV